MYKFYNVEIGLSGTGYTTTSFKQELFFGHEATALVRKLWLGIQADGDQKSYIKVIGQDGYVEWSCTSINNQDIDDIKLPTPFDPDNTMSKKKHKRL
ncbi:hypothetical protein SIO17_17585 [Pseudoalteromonas piscicida]|uniref:Uncharacterized protein n=1 Tax=Pseudoalteromonas piscicida TaxID=43662 RepID=A0ABN5CJM1_PSEO7|nr:hypothetical protein [Pseudoalteromonas piscicida]ATD08884.1 hypothetical protein PPIS_a4226 [Pseudoalteromonas piscicida]WPU30874.1 hypothetical protein SIO17_17585 [Pseudoalteromonas piscicida]